MSEITIKNYRKSRKFGWGYSFTPTGEDAYSIKIPTAPDYTGTLSQIQNKKDSDKTFQETTAFSSTAWFYSGQRITHTWQFTCLKRAPELEFDPESESYNDYLSRNSDHHAENDIYGYGWVRGWAGGDDADVKIRIATG